MAKPLRRPPLAKACSGLCSVRLKQHDSMVNPFCLKTAGKRQCLVGAHSTAVRVSLTSPPPGCSETAKPHQTAVLNHSHLSRDEAALESKGVTGMGCPVLIFPYLICSPEPKPMLLIISLLDAYLCPNTPQLHRATQDVFTPL